MGELARLREHFTEGLISYTYTLLDKHIVYKIRLCIEGKEHIISHMFNIDDNSSLIGGVKKEMIKKLKRMVK